MPLIFQKMIYRADLRANPGVLYVFGDNTHRYGMGGQAGQMRMEPNAVGICTKRSPSVFLINEDLPSIKIIARRDLAVLEKHLRKGGIVVWPLDGIGTGLAELKTRAPLVEAFYQKELTRLRNITDTT